MYKATALLVVLAAVGLANTCSGRGCETHPVLYSTTYDHSFETIKARIQKPAPDFTAEAVVDGEIKKISLSDYKGKYVVLVFFPLAFTFACPSECISFDENLKKFKELNTEIILMSVDSPYALLAWTKTSRKEGGLGDMSIPLASDLTHDISRDYGVLLKDAGHTLRGLFIIDDKGILRQVTMNDLPVGRSVEETLRLVQAFQHTDTHGTVCPSNWHPGDDTIVPDPEGKLEYFSKTY
eukprot:TRINITY_DN5321_c0_g1_i1.p1 TRINITY_DN5321_c0_g1~~TRINITY_DN5321_c0_g1_i1.p1  ORF type:complete len:238 (+),score=58.10 TRINITY_DN5321_c0_g1_i1:152-865(+)